MFTRKRCRGENFSQLEKSVIVKLIEEWRVEKKKTALRKGKILHDEWLYLYCEFIRRMGGKTDRSLRALQMFWKNICQKRRRKYKSETTLEQVLNFTREEKSEENGTNMSSNNEIQIFPTEISLSSNIDEHLENNFPKNNSLENNLFQNINFNKNTPQKSYNIENNLSLNLFPHSYLNLSQNIYQYSNIYNNQFISSQNSQNFIDCRFQNIDFHTPPKVLPLANSNKQNIYFYNKMHTQNKFSSNRIQMIQKTDQEFYYHQQQNQKSFYNYNSQLLNKINIENMDRNYSARNLHNKKAFPPYTNFKSFENLHKNCGCQYCEYVINIKSNDSYAILSESLNKIEIYFQNMIRIVNEINDFMKKNDIKFL